MPERRHGHILPCLGVCESRSLSYGKREALTCGIVWAFPLLHVLTTVVFVDIIAQVPVTKSFIVYEVSLVDITMYIYIYFFLLQNQHFISP